MNTLTPFSLLQQRRSTPARLLTDPGPSPEQTARLVEIALRVPDHGKLEPWRVVALRGDARGPASEWLVRRHREVNPDVAEAALDKDRQRFSQSPLILLLISTIRSTERIPEQEQLLSAGCVGFSLLLAAQSLGFAAQWLTGWAAYDRGVADYFGLEPCERILGFVHVGSASEIAPERARPRLADKFSEFSPP